MVSRFKNRDKIGLTGPKVGNDEKMSGSGGVLLFRMNDVIQFNSKKFEKVSCGVFIIVVSLIIFTLRYLGRRWS